MRVLWKIAAGMAGMLLLGACQTTDQPDDVKQSMISFITTHCVSVNNNTGGHRNKIKTLGYLSNFQSMGDGWLGGGFATRNLADFFYINPILERGICGRRQWHSNPRKDFRIDKTRLTGGLEPLKRYLETVDPEAAALVSRTGGTAGDQSNEGTGIAFVGDKKLYTNQESQITRVALNALSASGDVNRPVTLSSIDWFTARDLDKYALRQGHKALAVGYPSSCTGYYWSAKRNSKVEAAKAALGNCLAKYEETRSADQPLDCNCRLALLDDEMFMDPKSFETPVRTGFRMNVTDKGGNEVSLDGIGLWQGIQCNATGNVDITSLDEQKSICKAQATVDCDSRSVALKGTCFGDGTKLDASLDMGKARGIIYGTGEVTLSGVGAGRVQYGPQLLP